MIFASVFVNVFDIDTRSSIRSISLAFDGQSIAPKGQALAENPDLKDEKQSQQRFFGILLGSGAADVPRPYQLRFAKPSKSINPFHDQTDTASITRESAESGDRISSVHGH